MKLESIVCFLRYVGAMAGGLLVLSAVGLILSEKEPETVIMYALSCGLNALVLLGAYMAPKWLLGRQNKENGGMRGKDRKDVEDPS